MSETTTTNKPTLSSLVTALIASLIAAIGTHRSDKEAIAKQKAESDAQIDALQNRIAELEKQNADDAEVEGLRDSIEDALTQAQAAKPPTDDHVAEVEAIEPAYTGDETGGASPAGNTQPTE